jgi:hypothetical protein
MKKEQFDLIFEHLFDEAVQESYKLAPSAPFFTMKQSWETIRKDIEEQSKAN